MKTQSNTARLIRFQRITVAAWFCQWSTGARKTPPIVTFCNGTRSGLAVRSNTLVRFMRHGLVFQTIDCDTVQLTSHLLRHAFATELAELGGGRISCQTVAPEDVNVTKYYSRPTPSQVVSAAEMIFVDRIDVGAEALRSPMRSAGC
jgi:integrase